MSKKIIKSWKKLDDLDLTKLSQRQLVRLLQLQERQIIEYLNYYHHTEYYFFAKIEHLITEHISSLHQPDQAREIFGSLLSPLPDHNIFSKELLERYHLALAIDADQKTVQLESGIFDKQLKSQLLFHLIKYDFLVYSEGGRYLKLEQLIQQILEDLKDKPKLIAFIDEQKEKSAILKAKQTELDKTLSKDIHELVMVVRAMQEYKYFLRICLNKAFFGSDAVSTRLYREISRRQYYAKNQLEFMTFPEIIKVASGTKIELGLIKKRQDKFICFKNRGSYSCLEGEEASERINKIKPVIENVDTIKGSVANPGEATGTAKLIRLTVKLDLVKKQIEEMKNGEILVTETTGPELIVACQKAAAIVTNEGGINSHAAIVSRELGIPCIIGTKIAADIIKNGDLIKIDANDGIIKILERSGDGG